jgi:hypothetical protein
MDLPLRRTIRGVSLAIFALALTVVAVIALSRADAAAKQSSCGTTITTDTTLDSDLVDCPNNGIVIGADGVTLDLNGHLIDGDGTKAAGCDPEQETCDVGVDIEGHDGVTVMHGSVRDFAIGVGVVADHTRLLDISTSRNKFFGIGLVGSAGSLVRDSSGNGNGATGVFLGDSNHTRILHSTFRHNTGIEASDSTHGLIKRNVFSRGPARGQGILMEGGDGFQVIRNRFVRNFEGVILGPGSENVIAHNRISHVDEGIRIERGRDNLLADNVVVDAGRAGIRLGEHRQGQHLLGGPDNVLRENLVKGSGVDGFVIRKKDNRTLLKRNVAKRARDDGFDVQSRSTKLTKNRAMRNGDLGIQAVEGVTDGGGNKANHNGDRRQCTHVSCR